MSCCAICLKRFGFRGLKFRCRITCAFCHGVVCGRCYRRNNCCVKQIIKPEEEAEAVEDVEVENMEVEEIIHEEEVAVEETYVPYYTVLTFLFVLLYHSAFQHLAVLFIQYLAYLVVIFLAHFVMTLVNESSTVCREDREETQVMHQPSLVHATKHMSRQILTDIEMIRTRAEFEFNNRQQHIDSQAGRLGVMKRFPNAPGSKRAYRYKFQDSATNTHMIQRHRQLRKRLQELQLQARHESHRSNLEQLQRDIQTTKVMYQSVHSDLLSMKKEGIRHAHASYTMLLEKESPFQQHPVLHHRYVLYQLLGRGGFCEVWKVYDLERRCYVAAKFHTRAKAAYAEYQIQTPLCHPNIVEVLDSLIVGSGPIFKGYYVIIMEYVESNLAQHLKIHDRLDDVEAKNIVCQVLEALAYMNSPEHVRHRIIHYDLKPENVLLTESGRVKIADFGLSKFSHVCPRRVGLAGTYWYLPPEAFRRHEAILVNSTIDTWSVGVLLYELVCGQRPFGHGMSQQRVKEEQVILKASAVVFPTDIVLSDDTKNMIQTCLTYDQRLRPSIRNLAGLVD